MNVSWKAYVDQRFDDNDKAVVKLASELKEYKAQSNEWRGAMTDRESKFSPKTDTERIESDVKKLQLWEAKLSGMATQQDVNRAQMIAVVSAIGTVLSIGIAIASMIFK